MSERWKDQAAAARFVLALRERADGMEGGAPWWHGWAVRDAYLAGLDAGRAEHPLFAEVRARG